MRRPSWSSGGGPLSKVVVTGAAGFLGPHVAEYMDAAGYEVVRSDIVLPRRTGDSWVKADLTNPEDLLELARDTDFICHLGGIGDVYLAAKNPRLTMEVNVTGTLNLLEAAIAQGVRRVVVASSWEVYGSPKYEPVDEEHPCFPRHVYSISKLASDLLAQSFARDSTTSTVVLRIGTAYGPGMRESAVIPAFIKRAIEKKPIVILGTGEQFRQFTHVADIARAIDLGIRTTRSIPVYNVASPERTSIRDLALMVAERFPTAITNLAARHADAPAALISSQLAKDGLGWEPRIPFREGLDKLMDSWQ